MSDSFSDYLTEESKHRVFNHKASELNFIKMFIAENDIKIGTFAVPSKYVYALYCEQARPPLAWRRFTMYFATFFERKNTGDKWFYRLDPKPFNIPEGYTIWKDKIQNKFKYKKTKYCNIKSTPEGWMAYLNMPNNGGRKIFGFHKQELKAAQLIDRAAWFYFGPEYNKFNFPLTIKNIKEDDVLLKLLQLKKVDQDDPSKKESL